MGGVMNVEVVFGGVLTSESDLRDHREEMEEPRLNEKMWGDACASSHCIPQGELQGCSDLWLLLLLTSVEQSQMWATQGKNVTLGKVPLYSPSQTSVESFYSWILLAVLSKTTGVKFLYSHRILSITHHSYYHWIEAKKEEMTLEIQQRNQGNLLEDGKIRSDGFL